MGILGPALINGIVIGLLFGLLGLAIVVIFRTTGVGNFATGAMSMFGAFVVFLALVRDLGLPSAVAVPCAIVVGAVLGAVVYALVIAPREGFGHLNATFRTLGLFTLLVAVANEWWGGAQPYTVSGLFPAGSIAVGGLNIGYNQLVAGGAALVLAAVLLAVFRYSNVGLIMHAVAVDRQAARVVGIDVRRVEFVAWALTGAIAAVVGVLVAPITLLSTDMMDLFLIQSFTAVVLGGINSFGGAMVGGVAAGVVYSLCGAYFDPETQYACSLVLLLGMLLLRPAGLFGAARVVRV